MQNTNDNPADRAAHDVVLAPTSTDLGDLLRVAADQLAHVEGRTLQEREQALAFRRDRWTDAADPDFAETYAEIDRLTAARTSAASRKVADGRRTRRVPAEGNGCRALRSDAAGNTDLQKGEGI